MSGLNGGIDLQYTYGGEKIKIEGVKDKLYIGGVEYVKNGTDYEAETYYHGEGRILLDSLENPAGTDVAN